MKIMFLYGLVLLATHPARAETRDLCPPASSFYNQIYNCSSNAVAVNYGQACSDSLMAAAKVQGAALAATMNSMRASLGSAQSASMTDTATRLRMGIQQFAAQIAVLQASTTRVAGYTESMIDYAGANDANSSAPCFNKNFDKLQSIVSGLDDQILKSKAALKTAQQMLATVDHRDANLHPASVRGTASVPVKANKARIPTVSGKTLPPGSDISGTDLIKEK